MVALDESEEAGLHEREERTIVEGIIRLDGLTVADVMASRVDLVGVLGVTLLLVVFGEYVPKAWFRTDPYHRSARLVGLLYVSWAVFPPVGTAGGHFSKGLRRIHDLNRVLVGSLPRVHDVFRDQGTET